MLRNTTGPTNDPALDAVLKALVTGVHEILAENLIGVYLQGSVATGDWDSHSDVDWLAIIAHPLTTQEIDSLQRLHARLYTLQPPWAQRLEGSYFPIDLLRQIDPPYPPLWYLDNGSQRLELSEHDNTLVVRWVLREYGYPLIGPMPQTLLAPIPTERLQQEVLATMQTWAATFLDTPERVDSRWYQSFIVLSYCRMAQTLATGRVESKQAGVRWAQTAFDARWHALIRHAWQERQNPALKVRQLPDPLVLQETLAFVRYVLDWVERRFIGDHTGRAMHST